MFKKTQSEKQLNLQSSVSQYLPKAAYKQYIDETAWHNVFFKQVVCRIDEEIFSKLFNKDTGAPNASIRLLISMMILKEGLGCSDETLFENCQFDLLIRKALGIIDIDETLPAESTYYLLRKRIIDHQKKTGEDLFEQIFKTITREQIVEFNVSGKSLRMDSKLINCNIAFFSRYEIIHRAFCSYYKQIENKLNMFNADDQKKMKELSEEQSSKTVYRSNKEQIKERLQNIGLFIYKIVNFIKNDNSQEHQTLKRILEEQYKILSDNKIELRSKEEITANSVQSPYETECAFRSKDHISIKGYSHNVAETCDKDKLNLITDIKTKPATAPDNGFTIPATKDSQSILNDKIENIHADGAYNSDDNQEYTKQEGINFYLTGVQGFAGRYDLKPVHDGLQIMDRETGEIVSVTQTKGKFRINTPNGYRYFTQKEIDKCQLRKDIEQLPDEIKNVRNNVEATIYQLAYHLRKDKTKYRGWYKNQIWATLRGLWINATRIVKHVIKVCQRTKNNVNNTLRMYIFIKIIHLKFLLTRLELYGILKTRKNIFSTFMQF